MGTFQREPLNGGDTDIWGNKELSQNRLSIGNYQAELFDDSGVLKISAGRIGVYTGSAYGTIYNSASETIDISLITSGIYALITAVISGTSVLYQAEDIAGATDPDVIPTALTDSYNYDRAGYYSGNNRIIGIVWKTLGGALGGIINVNNGVSGYVGKKGSLQPVNNIRGIETADIIGTIKPWHKSLTGSAELPGEWVECNGQVLSDAESPYNGQTIPNLNGDPTGADSPGLSRKEALFLRGGLTSGNGQDYSIEYHGHEIREATSNNFTIKGNFSFSGSGSNFHGAASGIEQATSLRAKLITDDGTNPTPLVDTETRPANMSVVYIIKIK